MQLGQIDFHLNTLKEVQYVSSIGNTALSTQGFNATPRTSPVVLKTKTRLRGRELFQPHSQVKK